MDVDTIAAVATAPGAGAVAVVRVSGPAALDVLRRVAPGLDPLPPPRRAALATLRDPASGAPVDRGLVTVFPAPDSYTGEDVVEISGHGGWMAPALVLEACVAAGARPAAAGEFTRRAYLHGKMDLVQAEAVADLVEGRSRALHAAALRQLDRGLSSRLAALRERLVELEALLVHHLDFPEEDEPPVPVSRVVEEGMALAEDLRRLVATAPEGELLREGALTVLAGRPNSGKSSLFNALLGQERAIVTGLPGTTRDALEAVASLGGFPFRLVDTAGLRETEEHVERLGIEVAERYLRAADLVLVCVEAGRDLDVRERTFLERLEGRPAVVLRTKADLAGGSAGDSAGVDVPGVRVSVTSGEGLGRLRTLLPSLVYRGLVASRGEVPVLLRERQARGVQRALDEVEAFAAALQRGVPPEVAASHLRPAETALEETLGVISPEEVLDRVFSRFCIGK
ncbi:MAG: tRNA uridine-5-carboxymethylaminomethyl(34) synthesis GTPase MnmE [Gemmatimonadetes bacterium]|nr:tRNA uridine-5-carboxymethylaminomethyl(34) synthesis GTPase MnmE [Gemmatimonadota bacterium]